MGRAVDLFVTYRFLKLLTTPFEKTDAFKLGIIDKDGHRIKLPKSNKPAVELITSELKNSYTILHKLIFNTCVVQVYPAFLPPQFHSPGCQ